MSRTMIDLGPGWEFLPEKAGRRWLSGEAAGGIAVDLPHSWNARDTFAEGVTYRRGWGTYRRRFSGPEIGDARVWRLRSGGFYGQAEVWLNGVCLGVAEGEFLGFAFDVTTQLRAGENVLGIRMHNRHGRNRLPGIKDPDFLLHGGLAGGVWLEAVPRARIDEDSVAVRYALHEDGRCEITIRCDIVGADTGSRGPMLRQRLRRASCSPSKEEMSTGEGALIWRVRDPDGRVIAEEGTQGTATLQGDGSRGPMLRQRLRRASCSPTKEGARSEAGDRSARLTLQNPLVWSPESPTLYTVEGTLTLGGAILDRVTLRTGFRRAEFRPGEGFFLNGRRLELRGVNRHENMPGFGSALPAALQRRDAQILRDMGLNFVRLSHYPQQAAFLDACDELGLLVYAELASWKSVRTGGWLRAAERQWERMIRRDRNRPSVILWGMGNESRSRQAYERLGALAHGLDPDRPVTYAENHLYRARRQRTTDVADVWGLNYELDAIQEGIACATLRCAVVTEMSNYPPGRRGLPAEERAQVDLIRCDLERLRGHAALCGFALWSFADYATLRKRRYYRFCGVVDAWRQPKLSADWLRAMCADAPFVSLRADWSERGPAERAVWVCSNCEVTRLSVEGEVLAEWRGRGLHEARVPFRAGVLRAEGDAGKARAEVEPWAEVATFGVSCDELPRGGDGVRVVRAVVTARDAHGRQLADYEGYARVSAEGPLSVMGYRTDDRVWVTGGMGVVYLAGRGEGNVKVWGRGA